LKVLLVRALNKKKHGERKVQKPGKKNKVHIDHSKGVSMSMKLVGGRIHIVKLTQQD